MSSKNFSRRTFMKVAGTSAATAAATRAPVVSAPYPQVNLPPASDSLRILTLYRFEAEEAEKVRRAGGTVEVEILACADQEEFKSRLGEAEVVFGRVRGEDLHLAPNLKWVHNMAAGVEFLLEDEKFRGSPVVLTNCARLFAPGISETAMGLLLCLTRGITRYYMPMFYRKELKAVGTPKSPDHHELAGRTMGVVGMGGIGSAVARRAHYGFDMRIVGTDAKPLPKPEYVAELHDPSFFPEMVPRADVLVCAAPHTKATDRMFNERVFRAMKPTAYFLGLSRGSLFDDMALVRALKEGWIAGAGLDVFPQEPPPREHPIYDCPNVVMTPHTSGWGPERQARLIDFLAENVRRYTQGIPLLNVVDKDRMF